MKTPETQEEFVAVRDHLEHLINEIERIESERSQATETCRKQLELIQVPYRNQLKELEREEYLCRQALVEAYQNQSVLADAAMELGEPIPPQFEAPGVSFKSQRTIEVEDFESIPTTYTKKVPDLSMIEEEIDLGGSVPGVQVTYCPILTFRRKKSGKVGE